MSTRIVSLDEFRRRKAEARTSDIEFDALFRRAHELRNMGSEIVPGEVAVMNWSGVKNWFHKEMADEVFRKRLFDRCVLLSVVFASDLLAAFARDCRGRIGIAETLEGHTATRNPNDLLEAANAAFIMFSLWPDRRTRRSVRYRQLALDHGPSLYAAYAGRSRRDFGYCMAKAFEPLGVIARARFTRR